MERTGYQSLESPTNENENVVDESPPEALENDVVFHLVPETNKSNSS